MWDWKFTGDIASYDISNMAGSVGVLNRILATDVERISVLMQKFLTSDYLLKWATSNCFNLSQYCSP